ncbi:hypothetical protein LEP1GSC061_0781 [Leptospira wolffii serovar Khorat str. Khorat-H2]|nr:hypothetical protein LEP1GSC061_0781 [Leptospira wolffii serovar Khorat str. Khorat-H2]
MLISFSRCVGPAAYRDIPANIESNDSFIRFRLPDLGATSALEAPGEYTTVQDRKTYFLAIYLNNSSLLRQHRALSPLESHWKKFYRNFSSLPSAIVSEPRFNILPNCEYYFPVPSGVHQFNVFTYNRNHAPVGGGGIYKTINIPAEHSLRIHLRNPKDLPESQIDPTKYMSYSVGDQILFSLEPTPKRMEPQICEPELHSKNGK